VVLRDAVTRLQTPEAQELVSVIDQARPLIELRNVLVALRDLERRPRRTIRQVSARARRNAGAADRPCGSNLYLEGAAERRVSVATNPRAPTSDSQPYLTIARGAGYPPTPKRTVTRPMTCLFRWDISIPPNDC